MAVVGKYVRGLYVAGDVQGKFGVSYVKINIYHIIPRYSVVIITKNVRRGAREQQITTKVDN